MKTQSLKTQSLWPVPLAALLLALPAVSASAEPLVLTNVPAAEAAKRLGAKYGVDIVLKTTTIQHLNVAIDDADDRGSRLQTVNALANALRLDFTKTFVVSKAAGAIADPAPVDSGVSIPFGRTTMPTREAITLIAGVDDAFARIASDVTGTVTFSRPTLTAGEAQAEVARQTGTTWKTVYTLAPRNLVGWAASPFLVFPDRQREAQQRREQEAAQRQAAQEEAAAYQAYQQAMAQRQSSPQATPLNSFQGMNGQGMNGQGMYNQYNQGTNGMGYYSNGYGSYGNSYGNSGYGTPYGSGYGGGGYPSGSGDYGQYPFGAGTNAGGVTTFPVYRVGG